MKFLKNHLLKRVGSFILVIALVFNTFTPVYATDSENDLKNELNTLNSNLKQLQNEISSISSEMKNISSQIKQVKSDLAVAKGKEEIQYESMKSRIQYMYENGNTSFLEMLLTSSCMAEFLNRAEFFATVSEYDRSLLDELAETQKNIQAQEDWLASEQKRLSTLQDDLNEKRSSLNNQVAETSSELQQLQKAKEEARKAKEEAAKAEAALKQEVIPVKPSQSGSSSGSNSSDTGNDYVATASDLELFAGIIECEAGSSHYEGMLAVASVIVNRMNNRYYPDTLRGVIYQSGQFPPAHNGKLDRILQRGVKSSCMQVAQDALTGKNNVGDCLSFRSASSGHAGIIIGGNVFF